MQTPEMKTSELQLFLKYKLLKYNLLKHKRLKYKLLNTDSRKIQTPEIQEIDTEIFVDKIRHTYGNLKNFLQNRLQFDDSWILNLYLTN